MLKYSVVSAPAISFSRRKNMKLKTPGKKLKTVEILRDSFDMVSKL